MVLPTFQQQNKPLLGKAGTSLLTDTAGDSLDQFVKIISLSTYTITMHAHHIHHTCIWFTYHIHTALCMILHLPFLGRFQLVPSWLVSIRLFRCSVACTWRLCFLNQLNLSIGLLSCLCLRQLHKTSTAPILCSVCRGDNV